MHPVQGHRKMVNCPNHDQTSGWQRRQRNSDPISKTGIDEFLELCKCPPYLGWAKPTAKRVR